ncbi:gata transcription factor 6 [Phtheirospermum japonicum]|uniref:Gata transcription factor 6 n=1 Tax=Phtheirospermum japonicum TaxID=374723 RepID=A0A830CX13_9LAMI|nr:gata transcription factor 6 [Phtheirospermum japonicum]
MLYRTHHHPFLCTFNPFSHSSLSPHLLSSSSSSSSSCVSHPLRGMECVQGALVSGFGSETAPRTASFSEEFPTVNGVSGDDLFVDELLDFSNDFNEEEEQQPQKPEEKELEEKEKNCSVSLEKQTAPENGAVSVKDGFGPLPESELSVPAEGLESLEWLSHFVEDSFSDYSLTGKVTSMAAANRTELETSVKEQVCFTTPVQTKARTKRARTGGQTGEFFNVKPPSKKHKKKPADAGAAGSGGGQPRRCSHCGVTKTPQWRAGPLGSKTLCQLHSNNHRKVLEMRRKKEPEPEPAGLPPPVQSF